MPAGPVLLLSPDLAPEPELPPLPGLEPADVLLPSMLLTALAARLLCSFFFLSLLAKKLSWLRSSVSAKAAVWMGGGGAPGSEVWVKTVCVLRLPGAASPRGGSQGGRLPRALVLRSSPGTASVEQGRAGPAA